MPVAAFVPEAPGLLPELTGGAVDELAAVRAAAAAAVDWLLEGGQEVAIVGSAPAPSYCDVTPAAARLALGRYGVGGDGTLPLSLAVGGRLLARAGHPGPWPGLAVPPAAPATRLRELVADLPPRLLVVGDGSATRDDAPGTYRAEAIPYDDAVAAALGCGDAAVLAGLDPALGAAVLAAGTGAWRLAGHAFAGQRVEAVLRYYAAPFGVAYLVATWR